MKIFFKINLLYLLFIFSLTSCLKQKVDIIYYNGHLYSLNQNLDSFESMAIDKGRIVALGKSDDILKLYNSANKIDLKGLYIYPGFFDGHTHYTEYGRSLLQVNLTSAKSWSEVCSLIEEYKNKNPEAKIIIGSGWDQNLWDNREMPDNSRLNSISPNIPIILHRIDGHAVIVNQKVLDLAKINESTEVDGGLILRKMGKISGVLVDNAVHLISTIKPKETVKDYIKILQLAEKECFSKGITAVSICGLNKDEYLLIDSAYKLAKFNLRLHILLNDNPTNIDFLVQKGVINKDNIKVNGFKVFMDGALGSRGACLKKPYSDDQNQMGFLLRTYEHYDSLAQFLAQTSFQMCTHAIGDSANKVILSLYNRYLINNNDLRWRIEHAQVIGSADFEIFKQKNIIPSIQPLHALEDRNWSEQRLGRERMTGAYAYKNLWLQNQWLVLGTDFPFGVKNFNPLLTYLAAVYRVDEKMQPTGGYRLDESLSSIEALKGITFYPAKGCFWEKKLGSLEIDKWADFVILDKNILKTPAKEIPQIKILATISGGKKVFSY